MVNMDKISSSSFADKTVMVVDDSRIVRQSLTRLFQELHMKVVGSFESAQDALEALEQTQPDLVTVDILMPHFHGIEFLRKLRSLHPHLHVLMISAIAHDPSVKEALKNEIPAFALAAKPTSIEETEEILNRFFKGLEEKVEVSATLISEPATEESKVS
jgi:YesN/AraC family two-component response regulator